MTSRRRPVTKGEVQPKGQTAHRIFLGILKQQGIPAPEPEVQFHPTRKWRWDYAWPAQKVALEVQGGVWSGGSHGRGSGIVRDHEKFNAGASLGWRLLLVQPKDLPTLSTANLIRVALGG